MRIHPLAVAATGVLGLAAAVTIGAGAASAVTPVSTDNGFGVILNPGETAAVANSPIPGAIDGLVPPTGHRVEMDPESRLALPDGSTYASDQQILAEAAAHGGESTILLLDPGNAVDPGAQVLIAQHW
ncbi:hypothetical protein [Nocardia crassostreae]|uniref:hypothetical protein n=1 Tax=Nocardia crassostreae TaxID=53428 RepID=UPI00083616B7|nr:hypothetical protein [Nocardia crassostreae]